MIKKANRPTRKKDKRDSSPEEVRLREKRIRRGWSIYLLTGIFLALLSIYVLARGTITSTLHAEAWRAVAPNRVWPPSDKLTEPNRGNIYSDSETPLAITVTRYIVRMDFQAGGFKKSDSTFNARVDKFAEELSDLFGDLSPAQYKRRMIDGKNRGLRNLKLVNREISYTEWKAIQDMEYMKNVTVSANGKVRERRRTAHETGVYGEKFTRRILPYGTLAQRTIGGLQTDTDSLGISHGNSGLELAFDSLLCGKPGIDRHVRISPRWVPVPKVLPEHGQNVYTTLNIDIQDITEQALRKKLIEVDADWGTAVVMEVKTGEIKAMSNLDRISEGRYLERTNHAVADLLEPGSTFKAVSALIALEDGLVTLEDTIDVGNGLYHYARGLTVRDHNAHRGGYGKITFAQAMWYSSNIAMAKAMLKGYEGKNAEFLARLNGLSVFEPIDLEIPGTATANIKQDPKTWSRSTIPWVAHGYELQMPPIYTLRFYNAIANDGKMMEPYLVRGVGNSEKRAFTKKPKVVNDQIANKKTIHQLQELLRGVVTEGTARGINSDRIAIAGKTGTTQIHKGGYGSSGHIVTFCGYYPAEEPVYSCIVVVCRPRGVYPAGTIPGAVLQEIAEKSLATQKVVPLTEVVPDSLATFDLYVSSGVRKEVDRALHLTDAKVDKIEHLGGEWYQRGGGDTLQILSAKHPTEGQMPDLMGMATVDAIYLAEQLGLRVQISGKGGYVRRQSIAPGRAIRRGYSVTLTL